MITHRTGNLLEQPDLTHIAHQCNLYHTFGAGLAKQIAEKFPRALMADKATKYGDSAKLGTYSYSFGVPDIINLYCQVGFGPEATDYKAMQKAMEDLESLLKLQKIPSKLGLPFYLGCGLAGGNWDTVLEIIRKVFKASPIECVIVRLP